MTPTAGERSTARPREMQALGNEWMKLVVPVRVSNRDGKSRRTRLAVNGINNKGRFWSQSHAGLVCLLAHEGKGWE